MQNSQCPVSSNTKMQSGRTEEAFVLSSVKEFVKVWGSGSQAQINLEYKNGSAWIKLAFQLGHPADHHFVPHCPPHKHSHPRRYKGPAQHQKDRDRAAAHH